VWGMNRSETNEESMRSLLSLITLHFFSLRSCFSHCNSWWRNPIVVPLVFFVLLSLSIWFSCNGNKVKHELNQLKEKKKHNPGHREFSSLNLTPVIEGRPRARGMTGRVQPLCGIERSTWINSLCSFVFLFFHLFQLESRKRRRIEVKLNEMKERRMVNDDLGSFFTLLSLNPFSRFNEKWNKKERITRSFCSRFIERRTRIPFNSTGLRFPSHCNSSVSFGFLWGKDTKWKWEENHMLLMHILFLVFSVLCYNLDSFSFFSL